MIEKIKSLFAGKSRQATVSLIAAIFLLPILLALLVYHNSDGTMPKINNGHLLDQAMTVKQLEIQAYDGGWPLYKNHWTVVYLSGQHCNAPCSRVLAKVKRVRQALGKNFYRVKQAVMTYQRLDWILVKDLNASSGMDTFTWLISPESGQKLLKTVIVPEKKDRVKQAVDTGLFLMDPQGNIFMSYPSNVGPKAIYKDLQQALKASQVG